MKPSRLLLCTALAAVLALTSSTGHAAELSLKKVVVALKPDKDPEMMMQERKALTADLGEKLARPVDVIVPLSSSVIIEGLANGTLDLGYLSSTDMVAAQKRNVATILLASEIEGQTYYQSYWLSLKEKPYTSVAELKGKRVAFASKTSTSGYVIPMLDLKQKGLIDKPDAEAFFGAGNVFYGTGYVSAVERVLNGEAEAAAVSYYVLDKDKHLTPEQRARLKKVAEQGPVPTHVIAARASLSAGDRAALLAALQTLNEPANAELRDKVFTSKLIEVDTEAHLGAIRDALEFLGNAQ